MHITSSRKPPVVVAPDPAKTTLFLVVEEKSEEPVFINIDPDSTQVEMILECLDSSSWPVLIPHEAA